MHPCPNHNSVRVSRAYGYQCIHAQTIIPFVFREHTVTSASMPKPYFRSCFESIRLPVHPCPNHTSVCVSRAYGHQCIHAQTIIPFVRRHELAHPPSFWILLKTDPGFSADLLQDTNEAPAAPKQVTASFVLEVSIHVFID